MNFDFWVTGPLRTPFQLYVLAFLLLKHPKQEKLKEMHKAAQENQKLYLVKTYMKRSININNGLPVQAEKDYANTWRRKNRRCANTPSANPALM